MAFPDSSSPEDFGLPKSDYKPVADPTTDLTAAEYERLACAAAALTLTGPRAHVFVNPALGATAAIVEHTAVWGEAAGVKPTYSRISTGAYTITWATAYPDINPTVTRRSTSATNLRFYQVTPWSNESASSVCAKIYSFTARSCTVYTTVTETGLPSSCGFFVSAY